MYMDNVFNSVFSQPGASNPELCRERPCVSCVAGAGARNFVVR